MGQTKRKQLPSERRAASKRRWKKSRKTQYRKHFGPNWYRDSEVYACYRQGITAIAAEEQTGRRALRNSTSSPNKHYRDWHWGIESTGTVSIPDPEYPDYMIECGRLVQLRYRLSGQQGRDLKIGFTRDAAKSSHVAYNHRAPYQLYLIHRRASDRRNNKVMFWDRNPAQPTRLKTIAERVGGRHAADPYPHLAVKPVGVLTGVLYSTTKKGDGGRAYLHPMGEENGIAPMLCIDSQGRFWVAGGNYRAQNLAGIED